MRDRIIDAYLRDFVAEFGLAVMEQTKAFEHFVNYCVISRHHLDSSE